MEPTPLSQPSREDKIWAAASAQWISHLLNGTLAVVTETTLNGCGGIEQAATSSCPWICFEKPRADGITPPVEESRIGIQTGQALTRLTQSGIEVRDLAEVASDHMLTKI